MTAAETARVLIEALPYIRQFAGKSVVVSFTSAGAVPTTTTASSKVSPEVIDTTDRSPSALSWDDPASCSLNEDCRPQATNVIAANSGATSNDRFMTDPPSRRKVSTGATLAIRRELRVSNSRQRRACVSARCAGRSRSADEGRRTDKTGSVALLPPPRSNFPPCQTADRGARRRERRAGEARPRGCGRSHRAPWSPVAALGHSRDKARAFSPPAAARSGSARLTPDRTRRDSGPGETGAAARARRACAATRKVRGSAPRCHRRKGRFRR